MLTGVPNVAQGHERKFHRMREILLQYRPVAPVTWVCLSSLLMIAVFFKFSRFWSMRNLDVLLLMLLSPGLMLLQTGYELEQRSTPASQLAAADEVPAVMGNGSQGNDFSKTGLMKWRGYAWLLAASFAWLVRMILDPALSRRPLLAPNLSVGGISFLVVALFVFLMANVIFLGATHFVDVSRMDQMLERMGEQGPGNVVLARLPATAEKVLVIVAHVVALIGLVLIGSQLFGNWTNGVGAALLYLMIPYTSQLTGRLDHFLPAALMIWAVLAYRRPLPSGFLLGLAAGTVYYPLFLVPVWLAFYWSRGRWRFLLGLLVGLGALILPLIWAGSDRGMWLDLRQMFGIRNPYTEGLSGIWDARFNGIDAVYRLPILATFAALVGSFTLWPAHKNLATVLSCSAAIMLATQFWHGWGGGLFIAWYLPLVILVILRPNLEDRIATVVVVPGWWARPKAG